MSKAVYKTAEKQISYWLERVLQLCAQVEHKPSAHNIHDLRVYLRRSRSLASTMVDAGQSGVWKKLDKRARKLFKRLGKLRRYQVQEEWVNKLAANYKDARKVILKNLDEKIRKQKIYALEALGDFDTRQWKEWLLTLPRKARPVLEDRRLCNALVFARMQDATESQDQALQSGRVEDFHKLRLALKRFRYTTQNFMPVLYSQWEKGLKNLQDILGEISDLEDLSATLSKLEGHLSAKDRKSLLGRVRREQRIRIGRYRRLVDSPKNPWKKWRPELEEQTAHAQTQRVLEPLPEALVLN